MMPEVSGMQLFQGLMDLDPTQADRTIFMTGGAFSAEARHFLDGLPGRVLEKPFDLASLKDLVARQLDRSPAVPAPA
jgi:hypothetical protein